MTMTRRRLISLGIGAIASVVLAFALTSAPLGAAQPGPDPKLVGTWYWETSKYVSAGDYSTLIKTTRTVTLRADGTYSFVQVSIIEGYTSSKKVLTSSGTFTQQANTLTYTDMNGKMGTVSYQLKGNNGLVLDGVLFYRL
jgi:hypothetical protein